MKRSLGARALLYPAPVVVVGSYDNAGRPNAMTAAWAGVACSQPPCVAVSIRRSRYSYNSILERGAFTLNLASEDQVRQVDYFGIASGATGDKFAATGLTAVRGTKVDAPGVGEFPLTLECRLHRVNELGVHSQFIGEVLDVLADEAVLGPGGLPDISLLRPLLYSPGQETYFGVGGLLAPAFRAGRDLGGA